MNDRSEISYGYLTSLVGHLSGLAHLRATQLCTDALSEIGLTPKQFVALEFIANNPSTSQKNIASHIGTAPTVMVNVLDVLAERGYIERTRSEEDRRRHCVMITPAGEAIRDRLYAAAVQVEDSLKSESNLTDDEWLMLVELMKKLTNRP